MSSINFIENPMFLPEKDAQVTVTTENDREKGITAAGKTSESQFDLILDKHRFDSVKKFAQAFFDHFKFILPIKTALLLALTIMIGISVDGIKYRLSWTEKKWPNWRSALPIAVLRVQDVQTDFSNVIMLFVLCTIISIAFWASKTHKYLHSSVAVSNFCLSLLTLPLILRAFVLFANRAVAEWKWYYPRFANTSMTLQDVLEWPEKSAPNRWSSRNDFSTSERWREINGYADYPHTRYDSDSDEEPTATAMNESTKSTAPTFSDYELAEMGRKRMEIFVRLALDPTISALLLVVLILVVLSIFRYRRLVKSTGLWSSDYRQIYSAEMSSAQDARYANFWPVGLAKIMHWFIPGIVLVGLANGFFRIPYYSKNQFMCVFSLIVCWAICFTNWLVFVRMTRFRGLVEGSNMNDGSGEECQHHRLAKLWTIDFILGIAQIIFYFVLGSSISDVQVLFALDALACAVHGLYVLIFVKPKSSSGKDGACFGLNIPSVSINVAINVDRGNGVKGGGAGENEKMSVPNV